MEYIIYKTATGQIIGGGECADDTISYVPVEADETLLENAVADGTVSWVVDGVITGRPLQTSTWNKTTISADGIDEAILGNTLPNPTTVNIYGRGVEASVEVTDGSFEFSSNTPGIFTIYIEQFPYTAIHTEITAV